MLSYLGVWSLGLFSPTFFSTSSKKTREQKDFHGLWVFLVGLNRILDCLTGFWVVWVVFGWFGWIRILKINGLAPMQENSRMTFQQWAKNDLLDFKANWREFCDHLYFRDLTSHQRRLRK